MQTWKTLSRTTLIQPDGGKYLTLESHSIVLPDGQVVDDWLWLTMPRVTMVAAITESHQFLCFRQTKYAIDGTSLAAPGGYIDPGEDPLVAAKRELLEETGYEAPKWASLGSCVADGNRGAGTIHMFLAENARWIQPIHADDLEEQELLLLSPEEVKEALQKGEFKVLPWASVLALALLRLTDS